MNQTDILGIVMDICEDAITVCKLGTTSARSYNVCKKYLYTHGTFGEGDPDLQYEYPKIYSDPINHSFGQISLHATSLSPPCITPVYYLSYKGTRYVFSRDEHVNTIRISNNTPHAAVLSHQYEGMYGVYKEIGKHVKIYKNNLVLLSADDSRKLSITREWYKEPAYISQEALNLGKQLLEDTSPEDYVYDTLDEYDFSNVYYAQSV